nr:LptA/OstA family protein [Govania unica]
MKSKLRSLAGVALAAGIGAGLFAGEGVVGSAVVLAQSAGISALKNHNVQTPIDISADRLEVRSKDNVAIFEGRVRADQGDMTLNADRVTVYYQGDATQAAQVAPAQPASGQSGTDGEAPAISRIDAAGNVKLTSPTETATGSWGVYDMEKRLITVGGAVQLTRGETMVKGDRMQVDLNSGVTRLDATDMGAGEGKGRVRGRFSPAPEKKG